MKFNYVPCVAIFSLLFPSTAQAEEAKAIKDSNTPRLGQLSFFQGENTFLNDSSVSYANEENTWELANFGYYEETNKDKIFKLKDTLSYSFLKNHLVGLSMSYERKDLNLETKKAYNNVPFISDTNDKAESKGFNNPIFSYKYRFIEQSIRSQQINLDFAAFLSPNVFEAKNATYSATNNSEDGTTASGNTQVTLGAIVSQNVHSFIWNGASFLTYVGQTNITNTYDDATNTIDPYVYLSLEGNGQYYFNEMIGLDFGINLAFVPEQKASSKNDGSSGGYQVNKSGDRHSIAKLNIGLNFNAIADTLNLYVDLNSYASSDYNIKKTYNQTNSTSQSTYKSKDDFGAEILFGAKFLF